MVTLLRLKNEANQSQPFPNGRGGYFRINTSHLITKLLPSHLSVLSPYNPTSLPIRILNPTSPDGQYVKCEYAVRSFIQDLYDKYQDEVDAFVHLGMADGWEWYSVEERVFNERFTSNWCGADEAEVGYYMHHDAEGKTVRDIGEKVGKGMWDGMPLGLKAAGVNVRIVVDDVRKVVNHEAGEEHEDNGKKKMKVDVISNDEAGNYGCGFIFYESLVTCWKRKLKTRVVFCHVPGWKEPERLGRGADFVCSVIGAVCRQVMQVE